MKKFYEVVTMFFDDGKVKSSINIIHADEKPENTFEELKRFDVYKDYFSKLAEAKQFKQDALNC